ncbi:MAG: hypothetical protein JRN37_07575 [Nitrososphaerota archaeon]|jgi:hypothetical protein|nr:hypothetical protein [Nitrososphaerota archaeon]MDG7038992.1 hypothetical protein [Nitrososphaerota archaeon]
MNIVEDSVAPYKESVSPAIELSLEEEYPDETILLKIGGRVYTEDMKLISNLNEISIKRPGQNLFTYDVRVPRLVDTNWSKSTFKIWVRLYFMLNKEALDYIENVRQKQQYKDVVLNFQFDVLTLQPDILIGSFRVEQARPNPNQPQPSQVITVPLEWRGPSGNPNEQILISRTGQMIFKYSLNMTSKRYTIKASDWVNKFQRYLGVGKFMIVEIREPELTDVQTAQLSEWQKELSKRVNRAKEALVKMEEKLREGDWGETINESRFIYEVFDVKKYPQNMTKEINEFFENAYSGSETAIKSLEEAIGKLFDYASDLHHAVSSPKDGKALKEPYVGTKEDAYMVYILSVSLINIVQKEFVKELSGNNNEKG